MIMNVGEVVGWHRFLFCICINVMEAS